MTHKKKKFYHTKQIKLEKFGRNYSTNSYQHTIREELPELLEYLYPIHRNKDREDYTEEMTASSFFVRIDTPTMDIYNKTNQAGWMRSWVLLTDRIINKAKWI